MNKTVDLVNLWATFEKAHPEAEIADFCRFILIKEKEKKQTPKILGGAVPPDIYSQFAKLIGRITKIHIGLSLPLLKEYGINNFEDFAFLNSIYKLKNPKKTEVISTNFIELSSGLLIIDRLKKSGWITEKSDDADKRSKRLQITAEGQGVLEKVYKSMFDLNQQCFSHMTDDEILLCVKLMLPVEASLTRLWLKNKGKSISFLPDSF